MDFYELINCEMRKSNKNTWRTNILTFDLYIIRAVYCLVRNITCHDKLPEGFAHLFEFRTEANEGNSGHSFSGYIYSIIRYDAHRNCFYCWFIRRRKIQARRDISFSYVTCAVFYCVHCRYYWSWLTSFRILYVSILRTVLQMFNLINLLLQQVLFG